jgi:hypothetical protein
MQIIPLPQIHCDVSCLTNLIISSWPYHIRKWKCQQIHLVYFYASVNNMNTVLLAIFCPVSFIVCSLSLCKYVYRRNINVTFMKDI